MDSPVIAGVAVFAERDNHIFDAAIPVVEIRVAEGDFQFVPAQTVTYLIIHIEFQGEYIREEMLLVIHQGLNFGITVVRKGNHLASSHGSYFGIT